MPYTEQVSLLTRSLPNGDAIAAELASAVDMELPDHCAAILAVADAPSVDARLRTPARRPESGPDLLVTLDAYYRHDMHRGTTATALNVHTRTLDYRLGRVRDLTGIDPGSTRGVRTLSAVVTRRLSGAWR
uniref:helix-turn-helix domain-containing protein n=1 Tax=Streptomyces sp. TG1A-60 TaxID=3129111 RepID=UPI0040403E9D